MIRQSRQTQCAILGVSIGLLLLSAVAIFSAPANASHIRDPACQGYPYPNNLRVYGFSVDTPDSLWAGEVSGVEAWGIACGPALHREASGCGPDGQSPPEGYESLNVRIDMEMAPGVEINSTDNLEEGAYMGIASGNAMVCAGPDTQILSGGMAIRAKRDRAGTDCPQAAEVIACYRAFATYSSGSGYSYSWVTQLEDGTLYLTTGPVHISAPIRVEGAGFTRFQTRLCAYAGGPATTACGDSSRPWVTKNGWASYPFCDEGTGIFAVTVTNAIGDTSPTSLACVEWAERP